MKRLSLAALFIFITAATSQAAEPEAQCAYEVRAHKVNNANPTDYQAICYDNSLHSDWDDPMKFVGICGRYYWLRRDHVQVVFAEGVVSANTAPHVVSGRTANVNVQPLEWEDPYEEASLEVNKRGGRWEVLRWNEPNCSFDLKAVRVSKEQTKAWAISTRPASITMFGGFTDEFIAAFEGQVTTPYVDCSHSENHDQPSNWAWYQNWFDLCDGDYVCFVGTQAPVSSATTFAEADLLDGYSTCPTVQCPGGAVEAYFRINLVNGSPVWTLESYILDGSQQSLQQMSTEDSARAVSTQDGTVIVGYVPHMVRLKGWILFYDALKNPPKRRPIPQPYKPSAPPSA